MMSPSPARRPTTVSSNSRLVRRAWIPALLWLAVIAWESTAFAKSDNTSSLLLPIVRFFYSQITLAQFDLLHSALRKFGHFFGYAMLSLLMLRAWWTTLSLPRSATRLPGLRAMLRAWSARAALIAWLCAVAVAALDEWHQVFIPGRTGTVRDVVLDSMAAACVQLLAIAFSDIVLAHRPDAQVTVSLPADALRSESR